VGFLGNKKMFLTQKEMDQSLLAVESAAPPQKVEVVLKKAVSDSDSATGQTNEGDEEENATQKAPKQDLEMVEMKADPEPEAVMALVKKLQKENKKLKARVTLLEATEAELKNGIELPVSDAAAEPEPKVQPAANKGHQAATSSVSNGDLDGVIDVAMDVMSESDGTDAEDETAVAVPGRVP